MSEPARILYCHCAQAQVLPPAVKEAVLESLAAAGVAFEAVADLCELSAKKDPRLKALAAGAGAVRVAACFPRAVRWLFAAAEAPLPEDNVCLLNMRTSSAQEVIAGLLDQEPTPAAPAEAMRRQVEPAGTWKPWFPVIDLARCTHCMQCLSFCLFDVFGVSPDGQLRVQNPANCKTDCPACSRVCPEVAILFPKYKSGPINGEEIKPEDLKRQAMKVDISAILGGDIYSTLRDRSARARSRFSKERDENRALAERQRCLAQLQAELDIPPEVIAALPSMEQIQAKAEQAKARALEAMRRQSGGITKPAGE